MNRASTAISQSSSRTRHAHRIAASGQTSPAHKDLSHLRVHYISDHTQHVPRSVYAAGSAKLEKDGRATLYAAVKRALGKNDIVVLDSGNYIKGWRYQLHCEAKNLGTASCVVHVGVPLDKCRGVNKSRLQRRQSDDDNYPDEVNTTGGHGEDDPYDAEVFEELTMRFEEPNPMARWDSPLFTIPWEDAEPPCEQLWQELVESIGKDGRKRVVKPNLATVVPPTSSSSHLYELDKTTQLIVLRIIEHQNDHQESSGGEDLTISLDRQTLKLTLPMSTLTTPQLQRLRRQFTTLHRQQMGSSGPRGAGPGGGGLSQERIGELFVGFLESQWDT